MRRLLLATILVLVCATGWAAEGVVDEPIGARGSLGLTLYSMGHNAEMIAAFSRFLDASGALPALLAQQPSPPSTVEAILVEPELLDEQQRSGWGATETAITSGAGDAGPTVSFPLTVSRGGPYRLWVQYRGYTTGTGVTRLRIYHAADEAQGPIWDDEVFDYACEQDGPAWHDAVVDLAVGEYVVKLSHVTRWWHAGKGPAGYLPREIDCLYLTQHILAQPPDADERRRIREGAAAAGIQWTVNEPLAGDDRDFWRLWQLRPASWEQRAIAPELFALSREFWRQKIDEIAQSDYDEADPPDYRTPQRQVIFDDRWNMVANPVRIRRQVTELTGDLRAEPTEHVYYWVGAQGHQPLGDLQ